MTTVCPLWNDETLDAADSGSTAAKINATALLAFTENHFLSSLLFLSLLSGPLPFRQPLLDDFYDRTANTNASDDKFGGTCAPPSAHKSVEKNVFCTTILSTFPQALKSRRRTRRTMRERWAAHQKLSPR